MFISKLRFPKKVSIVTILNRRYGNQGIKIYRTVEKLDFKLKKTRCDINFLQNCISNNLTPTFVRFRLYKNDLHSTHMYRNFQKKLLEKELKSKRSQERIISHQLDVSKENLRCIVSIFDYAHLTQLISTSNNKKINSVNKTQERKLFKLGLRAYNHEHKIDPNKVIFNYSSRRLKQEEINALTNGLKFGLPPKKNKLLSTFPGLWETFPWSQKQPDLQ